LQELSRRLLQVQEEERQHLARELHDEIGQTLTGLQFTLELGERLSGDGLRENVRAARGLVRDLTARVRELSLRLRPTMLDDLGLLPALLWHFGRYTAQTGVRVAFTHHGLGRRFAREREIAAYRIVQEALTNVARHADVSEVAVRLTLDGRLLRLEIEDRGQGFDPEAALAAGQGCGLSGLRQRVSLLGGQFAVVSAPGAGARLRAELPVDDGEGTCDDSDDCAGR
jgi:signal transduction histidine kinase